jgi:hypothetical protein
MTKSRTIGLLQVLYSILVFCYTLYGYSKSISESFCSESRPGSLIWDAGFNYNVTYFIADSGTASGENIQLGSLNSGCYEPSKCLNITRTDLTSFFTKLVGILTYKRFNLRFNLTGFTVELYKDNYFDVLSCNDYIVQKTPDDLIESAFFRGTGFQFQAFGIPDKPFFASYATCRESSHNQDCSFSTQSQDIFLYLSGALILLFLILLFISIFSVNVRFALCFILSGLVGEKSFDLMSFCNPLTGKYSIKYKGDQCFVIDKCEPQVFEDYGGGDFLLRFKNYTFKISGCRLVIFDASKFMGVVSDCTLGEGKLRQVRHLLTSVGMDENNWPILENDNHFLEMEDFKDYLLNPELNLRRKTLNSHTVITNQKIESLFVDLGGASSEIIKVLIEHNKNFFGFLNLPCLINASNFKFGWTDRPKSSSNSQWKVYTNDVAKFLIGKGVKKRFFQLKNSHRPFTKAMIDSLKANAKGEESCLTHNEIAAGIDFDRLDEKRRDNVVNLDEVWEEVHNQFVNLENDAANPLTKEEMEAIDSCENSYSVQNKINGFVRVKEIGDSISEISSKTKDLMKKRDEYSWLDKVMKNPGTKTYQKAYEKWGGFDELIKKRSAINGEMDELKGTGRKLLEEKESFFEFARLKFDDNYLFLKKKGNPDMVKKKLLDELKRKESGRVVKKEECVELSVYSSLLKKQPKNRPKSVKRLCRINLKDDSVNTYSIELKNRYSALYPIDEDIKERLNSIISPCPKPSRKSRPDKNPRPIGDGSDLVDPSGCNCIKSSTLKMIYNKDGSLGNCKFKSNIVKNFFDSKRFIMALENKHTGNAKLSLKDFKTIKRRTPTPLVDGENKLDIVELKCKVRGIIQELMRENTKTQEGKSAPHESNQPFHRPL